VTPIAIFAGLVEAKTAYQALRDKKLFGFTGIIDTLELDYGLQTLLSDPKFNGTVFAPTNSAYEALEATIDDLNTLANIVRYHIVPSKLSTRKLKRGLLELETSLSDHRIQIEVMKKSKKVIDETGQSAKMSKRDIKAGKALIHIIDKGLLPDL
jgi:uncharacterized surface protein with fasciclin (FAS1) repeats